MIDLKFFCGGIIRREDYRIEDFFQHPKPHLDNFYRNSYAGMHFRDGMLDLY
ncbi:Uncharacterised protein [Shigella sonnei]|nr:Uncharacterised protein [Shigella sonnei]CST44532.1 Uncharacterised protein [Shigella sonnei]